MAIPVWQPSTLYPTGYIVRSTADLVGGAQNPVDDGGFESGTLDDWSYQVFGGVQTAYVTPTNARTGLYAFYWPGGAGTGNEGGIECLATSDDVQPVNTGLSVTAKGWFRYNTTGDIDGSQARMFLQWYDSSMVPTRQSTGFLIKGRGNNNRWVESVVTDLAKAGDAFVAAQFWVVGRGGRGHVYVDDISWDYVAPDPPEGLVFKAVQPSIGTSDSAEPTWPTVNGVQVIDGTVTWEAIVASRITYRAIPILKSGATEPVWPTTLGESVADNTISWQASTRQVTEAPNSKVVAITSSKVYAADGDIIRYSATVNPLDWRTADDAGYLPSGLNQNGSNDTAVLNIYRSALVSFSSTTFQNWQVDPDPANMSLLDVMEGIGSTWQQAAQPVAKDLFYLSQLGVRTVGISAGANNLVNGDVGMPIDPLVRMAMKVATENGQDAIGLYYPSLGQYWLTFGDWPPAELYIAGDFPDIFGQNAEASYQYSAGGGVPARTFSITGGALPPGMMMSASGLITGSSSVLGPHTWQVTVTDILGSTASLDDGTTIQEVPVVTGAAPDGGLNLPYAGYTYGATGGTPPYVFSNPGGGLPPGIGSLNSSGEIPAGNEPTQAGFFSPTIRVTDANNLVGNLVDDITVGTGIILLSKTASTTEADWLFSIGNSWPGAFTSEALLSGKSLALSTSERHIFYGTLGNPCYCASDGSGFAASTGTPNSGVGGSRSGGINPNTGAIILPQGIVANATISVDGGTSFANCGLVGINLAMCIPYGSGERWITVKNTDQQYFYSDDEGASQTLLAAFSASSAASGSCHGEFDDISLGFIGLSTSFPYAPKLVRTDGTAPVNEPLPGATGTVVAGISCGLFNGVRYAYAWTDSGMLFRRDMTDGTWHAHAQQPDGVPVGIAFNAVHIQMAVHKDNALDNEGVIYEIHPDETITELRRDVMPDAQQYLALSACRT